MEVTANTPTLCRVISTFIISPGKFSELDQELPFPYSRAKELEGAAQVEIVAIGQKEMLARKRIPDAQARTTDEAPVEDSTGETIEGADDDPSEGTGRGRGGSRRR